MYTRTPDDNDHEYFEECNLEYPAEIKLATEYLPECRYQTQTFKECFTDYMNSVEQPKYKPTTSLLSYLTDKPEIRQITRI